MEYLDLKLQDLEDRVRRALESRNIALEASIYDDDPDTIERHGSDKEVRSGGENPTPAKGGIIINPGDKGDR